MARYTFSPVAMVAALLLQACATPDETPAAPNARFDDECYVTGSRIRIRTADCRDAASTRGVQQANPSATRDTTRGNATETR